MTWPTATLPTEAGSTLWRPGSDDWDWATEFASLDADYHHAQKLRALAASVLAEGIYDPITLGGDGRVWDGHHRLRIAHGLGLPSVPVEFAAVEPPAPATEGSRDG